MNYSVSGSFEEIGMKEFEIKFSRIVYYKDYVVAECYDDILANPNRYMRDPKIVMYGDVGEIECTEVEEIKD